VEESLGGGVSRQRGGKHRQQERWQAAAARNDGKQRSKEVVTKNVSKGRAVAGSSGSKESMAIKDKQGEGSGREQRQQAATTFQFWSSIGPFF
jgi:hypothetical protein